MLVAVVYLIAVRGLQRLYKSPSLAKIMTRIFLAHCQDLSVCEYHLHSLVYLRRLCDGRNTAILNFVGSICAKTR